MISIVFNVSQFHPISEWHVSKQIQMCGTLVVDLHPRTPASAQAAINIVRCSLSAGGLGVLQVVIDSVGVGWCFTIFGGLCLCMLAPIWTVQRYGMVWRKATITTRRQPDLEQ